MSGMCTTLSEQLFDSNTTTTTLRIFSSEKANSLACGSSHNRCSKFIILCMINISLIKLKICLYSKLSFCLVIYMSYEIKELQVNGLKFCLSKLTPAQCCTNFTTVSLFICKYSLTAQDLLVWKF